MKERAIRIQTMFRRRKLALLLGALLLTICLGVASVSVAQPEIPQAEARRREGSSGAVTQHIFYQGVLKENGEPVTGDRDMVFRYYSDEYCIDQVSGNISKDGVEVTDGLFSVGLFMHTEWVDGRGLWLETEVEGTKIGCQEILPVPYAFSLRPGAIISATVRDFDTLDVRNYADEFCITDPIHLCWPPGDALSGYSRYGHGVEGATDTGVGVYAEAESGTGIHVEEAGEDGVYVEAAGSPSESYDQSAISNGLEVAGTEGNGLYVGRADYHGVQVRSADDDGVHVREAGDPSACYASHQSDGLDIRGAEGDGVHVGHADGDGFHVYSAGECGVYVGPDMGMYAGYFSGHVHVGGNLSKGGGGFKIDHPTDPENKYLYHSFVESPDMMNVYNGNVTLDQNGEAWVDMPDWFEALNRDFRYQLTPIGAPGPNLYIAQEVTNNGFRVAGGEPGMKVSWQVTGIRQDPYAEANRIPLEEEKPVDERNTYLHAEAYGEPETRDLDYIEANERLGQQTEER